MSKIKNEELVELYTTLTLLQNQPTPIKFCIAKNISALENTYKKYIDEKEVLFKANVKMDSDGEPVMKDTIKKALDRAKEQNKPVNPNLPYTSFEYEKGKVGYDKFSDELKELNEKEVEVKFITEKLSRNVKIKFKTETGEEYREVPIKDVLEDPENPVTGGSLVVLLKHKILED